ncbi:MAG: PEP/pyruvate-binding domain-containing protein [Candidatus Sabulitectum sp.]|nr:PEP/pyruvate-binding domain-containing protein [Candidatus Sabulitectum sp.]
MKGAFIKLLLPAYFVLICLIFLKAHGSGPDFYAGIEDAVTGCCMTANAGTSVIEDRETFDRLASGDKAVLPLQLSEVKFLITDIDTDNPKLYFINSNAFRYHWKFFNKTLGCNLSLLDFNTRTYTDFNRRLLAGSVVAHDRYTGSGQSGGIYVIEFWPSDPVHADEAALAFRLIIHGMEFAGGRIVYHPTGETQVGIYNEESELFESAEVQVLLTSELFAGVDYVALNTGEACGILRIGTPGSTFSARDIPVFQTIPNDISHVAGIITTIPQTPLSHINLKAMQNDTPNIYIPDFTSTDAFQSLLGKYVRLTAFPQGYTIEEIPFSAAAEWLESVRPDTVTVLSRELDEQRIQCLENIRLVDSGAYGAKAANLGELTWCLPSFSVPDGYAIPFYYYYKFMEYSNLYHAVDSLIALDEFRSSAGDREDMLWKLRQRIRNSEVPLWMMDSLSVMAAKFEPGEPLRCRSSTNNEDMPGFNGAGLYRSFTHHTEEGHISETVKQVWAGMWTYRAFEEREFHRISHLSGAMGVLVHQSYRGELANGVAVSMNIFNPFITGYYVNVQIGEDMVTNPESESVPEEFLLTEQNITGSVTREIQYIRFSNRVQPGERILSVEQIERLADYLDMIHNHYRLVYGINTGNLDFAMEIEFKITFDGELIVKQARPWVCRTGND